MRVELNEVAKGTALPATSLSFTTGEAAIVEAETERRPTVLSLIASGRMRPASGTVTIDGVTDYARMRATIALVDAPEVSEAAGDVTLAGVVAEELMFAGRAVRPSAVRAALQELGAERYGRVALADVPAAVRIRVLCELALYRDGVRAIVLTSPDRHGGEPAEWWAIATELADRGYAVLVVAGRAAAAAVTPAATEPEPPTASIAAAESEPAGHKKSKKVKAAKAKKHPAPPTEHSGKSKSKKSKNKKTKKKHS